MRDPSSGSLLPDDDLPPPPKSPPADPVPQVARALALLWTYRPRTTIHKLLGLLGWRYSDTRAFSQEDVRQAIGELRRRGWVVEMPRRGGFFRLHDSVRAKFYREMLDASPVATLRDALNRLDAYGSFGAQAGWPIYDPAAAVARLRLALYSGTPANEIEEFRRKLPQSTDWGESVWSVTVPSFDAELFERVTPEWRWAIANMAVAQLNRAWDIDALPVCEWAIRKLDTEARRMPEHLRLALAELLMHRGEHAHAQRAIEGLTGGGAEAMRAYTLVQSGAFADAQAAFETAFKARHAETNARKRVLPPSIAWLYPMALLAQQTPKHLELARKFCVGEAGSRTPDPHEGWGRWVHAIDGRLGDQAPDRANVAWRQLPREYMTIDALWELLLAAWAGRDATATGAAKRGNIASHAAALRTALEPIGFRWLASQVDAAEAVLRGDEPPPGFFVSGPRERWRDVLAALQALGAAKRDGDTGSDASRLVWSIRLGKRGTVDAIEPLEQKKGPRGYGKPKAVSLPKVANNDRLPPWDARIARAIRKDRYDARRAVLDRAAAIMALVGHPAVVLAEAPEQFVDVVEGAPELEVVHEQGGYRMRVTPQPHADEALDDDGFDADSATERELAALKMITVVRDSSKRLRVVRLTTAQRRAAQLVAGAFRVPAGAQQELHATLRALAVHFQVHDDHAQAAREVEAEPRLRAELSPVGEHLALRLVAAPLGPQGPRIAPGAGRARLMAAIGGRRSARGGILRKNARTSKPFSMRCRSSTSPMRTAPASGSSPTPRTRSARSSACRR